MTPIQAFLNELDAVFARVAKAPDIQQRNLCAQYVDGMLYGALLAGLISYDQWEGLNKHSQEYKAAAFGGVS